MQIGQRVRVKTDLPAFINCEGIIKGFKQEANTILYIVEIDTEHAQKVLNRTVTKQRRYYLEYSIEEVK